MRACSTGVDQLRAALGADWTADDETGSGSHCETNDVAIIWPLQRKRRPVTAYYADSTASVVDRHAVLGEVGRIAAPIYPALVAGVVQVGDHSRQLAGALLGGVRAKGQ